MMPVQLALLDVGPAHEASEPPPSARTFEAERLAQIALKVEADADAGLLDFDPFDSRDACEADF